MAVTVWRVRGDADAYHNLVPVDEEEAFDFLERFDGRPWRGEWTPLRVEVMERGVAGDFPSFSSHVPVCGARAAAELAPLLEGCAELLALSCDQGELFAVNVLIAPGALDAERSGIVHFPGTTDVESIERYAFREDRIRGRPMFKLAEEPRRAPFALEELRARVEAAGLRGLLFDPVG